MTAITNLIQLKRGDTLFYEGIVKDTTTQQPFNITGWTGRSQVRTKVGGLVSTCTFQIIDAAGGKYSVLVLDTSSFPVSDLSLGSALESNDFLRTDVEFTLPNSHVRSTDTIYIRVDQDDTY